MSLKKTPTKRITFSMTLENDKALTKIKKEDGISRNDFINYSIEQQVKKQQKGK